ncbi:Alpha/Beta hydrolase protein [Lophiotrema nucula]|uniref:Alpha/Beta hydrolase protein n=1 Tax=Lophiotrema nucula TaxID=690887 RepID=A0A6A5ZY37_9PLEO|nr:Alpha/Beta hydrolase protein [Lophiotrema nucula]
MKSSLGFFTFLASAATTSTVTSVLEETNPRTSLLSSLPKIEWIRCPYGSFVVSGPGIERHLSCTKLQVPLDYVNTKAGTVEILFMKFAVEHETSETKSILFNPGGPGVSGIDSLRGGAEFLREVFGSEYNIIAFDPRGVQFSGPDIDCFQGNSIYMYNFWKDFGAHETELVNHKSKYAFASVLKDAVDYDELCRKTLTHAARYIGTPAVAQDMLTFIEAQAVKKGKSVEEAKKEKLYYYGASYGTAIGQTFATLFPDRVGRMAIDGVMDGENYYNGLFMNDISDADQETGPDRCGLFEDSPDAIERRVQKLLSKIHDRPIQGYTYAAVKRALFRTAQHPLNSESSYTRLLHLLLSLERDEKPSLAQRQESACFDDVCEASFLVEISCVDSDGKTRISTYDAFEDDLSQLKNTSWYAGDLWSLPELACSKWSLYPPARKFGAKTSVPLLILSNTLDPICSVRNARKAESLFPGSILLVQDAVGHVALETLSKNCTLPYVRQYFDEGILPPVNTTCPPEKRPSFF